MIYSRVNQTDLELMTLFINKIKKEKITKFNTSFFEKDFFKAKNKIKLTKNYPATLNNVINNTFRFLKDTNIILVDDNGNISINEELDKKQGKTTLNRLTSYLKENVYADFLKNAIDEDGKIDRKKSFDIINKEFKKEGYSTKPSNIKRVEQGFYSIIFSVLNEEREYEDSLMYKVSSNNLGVTHKDYTISNNDGNIKYVREKILEKLNVKNKEKSDLIRDKVLTDQLIDEVLEKNYNNDIDYFISDINNEDIELPNYREIIDGLKERAEKIYQELINGTQVVFINDRDNDGLNAFTAQNAFKNVYQFDNIKTELADVHTNDRGFGVATVNHGINLPQLKQMVKNGVFDKNKPLLIVTADNGINSNEEVTNILNEFKNSNIIITDHHTPDELVTKENDRVSIVDYEYKSQKEKLKGFGLSGTHTMNEILKQIIYKLPEQNQTTELLDQIETNSSIANYMDLVHSQRKIQRLSTADQLSNFSNKLNAINTLNFLWTSNNVDGELFKKDFFANDIEREKLKNTYANLMKQSKVILNVYEKIKNKGFLNTLEVSEEILKLLKQDTVIFENENKTTNSAPIYLISVVLDFISKNKLSDIENELFEYIQDNKILEQFKIFEKSIFKPLRRNLDKVSKNYNKDYASISEVKHSSMSRKFYKKLVPMSNKGIEITMDSEKKEKNLHEKYGSIRTRDFVLKDIFTKEFLTKVKDKTGIEIEIHGHWDKNAAGFYLLSKKNILQKDIDFITNMMSKQYERLDTEYANKLNYVYDPKLLKDLHQISTIIKTPSSFGNHKMDIYVKADQVPFTNDVVNAVSKEEEKEMEYNNENVGKGWETANILLSKHGGIKLIARTTDIKNLKPNDYFKVRYLSTDTYIVERKTKINSQNIEFVEDVNTMLDKQVEFYQKNYTEENNFTSVVNKKQFEKKNILIDDFSKNEELIKDIMDKINVEQVIPFDTEGSGFGTDANLFQLGLLHFIKNSSNGISLKNTRLIMDPEEDISIAIEDLTGITNKVIKKEGMTKKKADQILPKAIDNKNTLYIAHNSSYDSRIVSANLPVFSEMINKNLLVDSAGIARTFKLAVDNREKFGSLIIKNKSTEESILTSKTFLITSDDQNSINHFIERPSNGKIIKNINQDISYEWLENSKGKLELIEREMKNDNKKVIIGKAEDLTLEVKGISKATKFSVEELLTQYLVELTKEERTENKNIVINEDLSLYVTKIKEIDKNIDSIIELYKTRDIVNLKDKDFYLKKAKQFIDFEALKNNLYNLNYEGIADKKYSKTKKVEERKDNDLNDLADKVLSEKLEKIILTIEKNRENIENYMYSSSMKVIVHNYNPLISKQANIENIKNEMLMSTSYIEQVIENIEKLNKKYNEEYKSLLKEMGKQNFTELFTESHNNLDFFTSDTALESIIVMDKLEKSIKGGSLSIGDVYAVQVLDTETKQILEKFKDIPAVNTYSFRQILSKGDKKTSNVKNKYNRFKKLYDDKQIIKIKLENKFQFYVKLNDPNISDDEMAVLGRRLDELLSILVEYQTTKMTRVSSETSLLNQINKKTKKDPDRVYEGFESLETDLKMKKLSYDEIYKKYESYIPNMTATKQKSVKTNFAKLINFDKQNSVLKFLYDDAQKELRQLGDFEFIEPYELKMKDFVDKIKDTLIETYIMFKKDELKENEIESKIKILIESKFLKLKRYPTVIPTKYFQILKKNVISYLEKMETFIKSPITNNSKKIIELVFYPVIYDKMFTVSDKQITFTNDIDKINNKKMDIGLKNSLKSYNTSLLAFNQLRNIDENYLKTSKKRPKKEVKKEKNLEKTNIEFIKSDIDLKDDETIITSIDLG